MSLVLIRQALETHLNSITPTLSTAWENVPFKPVTNEPYQQVNLVVADNKDITVSDASYLTVGFMQVLLVYPISTGTKLAALRADLISSTFQRGLQLTAGDLTTEINKTPKLAPAFIDGATYKLPVTIHFKTFISL